MKKTILAAVAAAGLMTVAVPASAAGVGIYVGTPGYSSYDYNRYNSYDYDRDHYYNRDDSYWRSGYYNRYRARVCNQWQWQDHPGYCRRLMWQRYHNY